MEVNYMEDMGIVVIGTFMHLTRLGPFSVSRAVPVELVPNAASTLLAVTLLVALTKWRPIRGDALERGRAQRLLRLVVELTLLVTMVEFALVWLWVPMLTLLANVCEWATDGYLEKHFPKLANWVNDFFFSILRLLLAVILALVIAVSQGWLQRLGGGCGSCGSCSSANSLQETSSDDDRSSVCSHQSLPARVPSSRPIVVRYSEGSTRPRNREPYLIRYATLDASTA